MFLFLGEKNRFVDQDFEDVPTLEVYAENELVLSKNKGDGRFNYVFSVSDNQAKQVTIKTKLKGSTVGCFRDNVEATVNALIFIWADWFSDLWETVRGKFR